MAEYLIQGETLTGLANVVRSKFGNSTTPLSIDAMATNINRLSDVSSDTVTADKMLSGTTAHDKSGAKITGTIRNNYGGYHEGFSALNIDDQAVAVAPDTYYDRWFPKNEYMGRTVYIPKQPHLLPENIKAGATIFGVAGTVEPERIGGGLIVVKMNTNDESRFIIDGHEFGNGVIKPIRLPDIGSANYQLFTIYVLLGSGLTHTVSIKKNGVEYTGTISGPIYNYSDYNSSYTKCGYMFVGINADTHIVNGDILEITYM